MSESTAKWDSTTKRIVALVLFLIFVLVVYRFRIVLPPLLIAFLLAFVIDPAVDFLEVRAKLSRTTATAVIFLALILAAVTAPVVAVPPVLRAIRSLNLDFAQILLDVERLAAQPIVFLGQEWDLLAVYQELREALQGFISTVASGTFDVVLGFASTLFWLVFILLSAFYLVRDANRIISWLDALPPTPFREDFVQLRLRITEVWHAFLRGQLLMGVFLAVITTVTASIVGLPNALALGLLAGVMEFIPNIGPIIAAVPAVAVAFFEGSTWIPLSNFWFTLLVLGLYLIIQQVENNLLLPRVMGQSLDLHPLIVLIAVIAGGSLAGILGMLIAAPMVATLRVMIGYIYHRLTDQDPFPAREKYKRKQGLGRRLWNRLRRHKLVRQWRIRPARPEDAEAVQHICARLGDGDDYIAMVWDAWLNDPHGELSVLDLDGCVLALGKLTRIADDEWWLEGLRVDPDYHRMGIAGMLLAYHVELAERVGAGMLRFGTASHNRPVHKNAERAGFTHVAAFAPFKAEPLPGLCALRRLTADDVDAAWQLIEHSPIFEAAAGLYEIWWQWMALTRARLAAHLTAGDVWGSDIDGQLQAIAITFEDPEEDKSLTAGYLDGTPEGLTAITWGLRMLAGQKGTAPLRARCLSYPPLVKAVEAGGAKRAWEHELWIYERPIMKGDVTDGRERDRDTGGD
ncbi:MAG: AI-2E family transporter [Anaerolineae bacterium]|nr:AI-2E family transporter [Anaerolineae bacterium]